MYTTCIHTCICVCMHVYVYICIYHIYYNIYKTYTYQTLEICTDIIGNKKKLMKSVS